MRKLTEKKKKATSFKSINKSDNDITRVDEKTFYVKRSGEGDPYMVFNSQNEGFLCDCLSFVYNLEDNNKGRECKHIVAIRKKFNL